MSNPIKILFAVRTGNEDWQEELIAEREDRIEAASKWAQENGFDRLRVAEIDLGVPPDFGACVQTRSTIVTCPDKPGCIPCSNPGHASDCCATHCKACKDECFPEVA